MIRHCLGALGLAAGLALASVGQAQAQALTVPPHLRAPSEATPPEPAAGAKAKPAKPKHDKRTAQKAPAPNANSVVSQPEGRRMYPPDIDRSESGSSVKPSMTPSGRMGFGGRF